MKASVIMKRADKHRTAMEASLSEVRKRLQELLDTDETDVFYKSLDGWVILFGKDSHDSYNAKLTFSQIDELLRMGREQAIEFLFSERISR